MALHELNHPDEIIDDEVFKRQCAHWKAEKEEAVIPAEYCDDAPPLQKNAVINEIKLPGIWQLEEVYRKATDNGEEQKEEEGPQEEGPQEDDTKLSFTFPDDAQCVSFEALAKKLMAQDFEVMVRDAFFEYIGAPNVAKPSTKKKKKVKRKTTPRHPRKGEVE